MPNFSPAAAAADAVDADVTFDDLIRDVDRVVARLKVETANRRILDDLGDQAEDIIPGEFRLFVQFQDSMFHVDPAPLGIASLAPLVDPMRRAGAESTVRLVQDLEDTVAALVHYCTPPGGEGQGDGPPVPIEPAGSPQPAASGGLHVAPGGLLASLQQRAGRRTDQPAQPG